MAYFEEDGRVQAFVQAALLGSDSSSFATAVITNEPTALMRLIPLAARRLGFMWDMDQCSFFDVTVALNGLCRLVRAIAIHGGGANRRHASGRSILITTLADNEHMLGPLLLEAAFIRSGWEVIPLPATSVTSIFDFVSSTWVAAVGISIACDRNAAETADMITALRSASSNTAIVVLVGGASFASNPGTALRLGADATADNASLAVAKCGHLVPTSTPFTEDRWPNRMKSQDTKYYGSRSY